LNSFPRGAPGPPDQRCTAAPWRVEDTRKRAYGFALHRIRDTSLAISDSIAAAKTALRASALSRREKMPAAERQAAAEAVAARPFPLVLAPGAIVSGYMPLKSELNPLPLMRKLAEAGATLALPVVAGRGKPLIMRAYAFGQELDAGVWGIREPKAGAAEVDPDILLVPLAAFDRAGNRLGYGAGYYDMTIGRLRKRKPAVAVGIAYAAQEVPRVPTTPRDEKLDLVLTEREVIDCRGS
jgi:5-formyltetrahydrofolate cyclo-ligase